MLYWIFPTAMLNLFNLPNMSNVPKMSDNQAMRRWLQDADRVAALTATGDEAEDGAEDGAAE